MLLLSGTSLSKAFLFARGTGTMQAGLILAPHGALVQSDDAPAFAACIIIHSAGDSTRER